MRSRHVALLGMAALLAAMLGRAGFVDWERVLAAAVLVGGVLLVGGLFVLAVLAGAALLMAPLWAVAWLLHLCISTAGRLTRRGWAALVG